MLTLSPQKFAQELEKERADASAETRTLPPPKYRYAPKKHTHYVSTKPSPLKTVQILVEDPVTHGKAVRKDGNSIQVESCRNGKAERKYTGSK